MKNKSNKEVKLPYGIYNAIHPKTQEPIYVSNIFDLIAYVRVIYDYASNTWKETEEYFMADPITCNLITDNPE